MKNRLFALLSIACMGFAATGCGSTAEGGYESLKVLAPTGAPSVALSFLAEAFEDSINQSTMCAYRLSGDEFVILMFQGNLDQLENTVKLIREKIEKSNYSAAIGYYFIDPNIERLTFEDAMKKAEELMYLDKAKYYKECGHDRRSV